MDADVPAGAGVIVRVVGVRVTDPMRADPLGGGLVLAPVDRPAGHVMDGRAMHPAVGAFAQGRMVHLCEQSVADDDDAAAGEVRGGG